MDKKMWRQFHNDMCKAVQQGSTEGVALSEAEYPALRYLDGLGLCALLTLAWYILQLEKGRNNTPVAFVWLMDANSFFNFSEAEGEDAVDELMGRGWLKAVIRWVWDTMPAMGCWWMPAFLFPISGGTWVKWTCSIFATTDADFRSCESGGLYNDRPHELLSSVVCGLSSTIPFHSGHYKY